MLDPKTTRAALDAAEKDLTDARARAADAADALDNAVAGRTRGANLPDLRRAREGARLAVDAAIAKRDAAQRDLAAAVAEEQRRDDERRAADAAAEKRAAEQRAAEVKARALAEPLALLDRALAGADGGNAALQMARAARTSRSTTELVAAVLALRTPSELAVDAATVAAALGGEHLETAIEGVAKIDPQHPAIGPARAKRRALRVHDVTSDVADGVALVVAARKLLAEGLTRIASVTKHADAPHPVGIARSLVHLGADGDGPPTLAGLDLGDWIGGTPSRENAHDLAAFAGGFGHGAHDYVRRAEAGEYVLAGRQDEIHAIGEARKLDAALQSRADTTDKAPHPVLAARSAVNEITASRRTRFAHPNREAELVAMIGAVARDILPMASAADGKGVVWVFGKAYAGTSARERIAKIIGCDIAMLPPLDGAPMAHRAVITERPHAVVAEPEAAV
jgi:hypothetical protein